jgi:hypothetical protein
MKCTVYSRKNIVPEQSNFVAAFVRHAQGWAACGAAVSTPDFIFNRFLDKILCFSENVQQTFIVQW